MSGSVIVVGARTPMGRLRSALKGLSGAQLGVTVKAALEPAGVAGDQIQYMIKGASVESLPCACEGASPIEARPTRQ